MIVIFEGANGVGKTAYATGLAKQEGWPVYRAYRRGGEHHDEGWLKKLRDLGIPANRYAEDMFLAEYLRAFKPTVILDRSLPSALVYDEVFKQSTVPSGAAGPLLDLWQESLSRQKVLYVWLIASHSVAKERGSGAVLARRERDALDRRFARLFARIEFPKLRLDTGEIPIEDGLSRIVRVLRE